MKLKKVQVTNFRSVEDSEEFDIDSVTCLVGKNEAGKSALLLALAALNPNSSTPVLMDKERDYPRKNLTKYDDYHSDEDALVVRTIWELDQTEVENIEDEIGKGVLKSTLVEVRRRFRKGIEVVANLNYMAAVEHECNLAALNAAERSMLKSPKTVTELIDSLENLDAPKEKHLRLLERLREKRGAFFRCRNLVIKALPTFMYVSSYDRMDGAIQIEETQARLESEELELDKFRGSKLFMEFLNYAGVPMDEIIEVDTYETFNARLQAASTNITDQILEYWSQNPDLDVEVRINKALDGDAPPFNEGTIARARIKNNLHKVDTPFSERSAGFVWFFSFLVKFAQVKNEGLPVILLLDEPGLSLHGKAQQDLLRFIDEKLAPSHQVIYSTHSPFMVPVDKLDRVRIVEDKIDKKATPRKSFGTKVSEEVLMVEADTLFPLQGALGYEVTQALFVGEHTLLVEGPSDILYLQALSNALIDRRRSGLDPRWTMCPAGSIDRIMPFVSLFTGHNLHIAVLSDEGRGDKGTVRRIRQSNILQAGHYFTVVDFINANEGDIEDLFDVEIFVQIINESYQLPESQQVTVAELEKNSSTTQVVKKVEAMFNLLSPDVPVFNHFTPAAWLIRNPDFFKEDSAPLERTLSLAEKVFETYNNLLPRE